MTHCCSQCSFTAQFASALTMHRQLVHGATDCVEEKLNIIPIKSNAIKKTFGEDDRVSTKGLGRTNSATKLFERFRSRICRSKAALFSHPEEVSKHRDINLLQPNDLLSMTKLNKADLSSRSVIKSNTKEQSRESYQCHLCPFNADRITVLDRHLLNDHKIGLDNLLKLVMAKTKDGVTESGENNNLTITEPYYKPQDEIIEEGEFIVETVAPKIKILKHASTNTNSNWNNIPNLKDNCKLITEELETLMTLPIDDGNKDVLFSKMQRLNDCMCKFFDSSNSLKRFLNNDIGSKSTIGSRKNIKEDFFNLGLGDQDSRGDWSATRSIRDRIENTRSSCRSDNPKSASSSFYY